MWLKFMRVCCSTVAHHLGLLLFRRWVFSSFAISQADDDDDVGPAKRSC